MGNTIIFQKSLNETQKQAVVDTLQQNARDQMGLDSSKDGAFAFVIEDSAGRFCAGLEGYCYHGCCHIDIVDKLYRNQGLGAQLMQKVEEYAHRQECKFLTVNTMNFEAKPFYEKQGFQLEFTRHGYHKATSMHFLIKTISKRAE